MDNRVIKMSKKEPIPEIRMPGMFTLKQFAQDIVNATDGYKTKTKEDKKTVDALKQLAQDVFDAVAKYEEAIKNGK